MAYNKDTDYTALMQQAAAAGDYRAAALYEQQYNEKVTDMINSGNNPNGYTTSDRYTRYLRSTDSGTDTQLPSYEDAAGTVDNTKYTYNASDDAAYMQALQALQQAQSNAPTYAGTYDGALEAAYDKILNRESFKYDINADALYQQYKDGYINQGQMAMMDTMGQAAALTGGYGSSYGQSVGQQQYNAYLQQLNDVVPELYGMALDRYNAEGDTLAQQAALIGDLRDTEYSRYQDALDRHWQQVDYLQEQADDAYSRGYESWYNTLQMQDAAADDAYQRQLDAYQMQQNAEQIAYEREQDDYNKQQDSYDRLVEMIMSTGYEPNAYELSKAGMTQEQYAAWKAYYDMLNPTEPEVVYGGGGGNGAATTMNESYAAISSDVAALRNGGATDQEVVAYLFDETRKGTITAEQASELEKRYTSGVI